MSLQKCLLSWNKLKKFAETFLSHVLFLENVNSSYSLSCFKVPLLNPSEGEIVEVWVSDPSHHRCFKMSSNSPLQIVPLFEMVFIGPESCCNLKYKMVSCFCAMEFNRYLNYSFCTWTNSMPVILSSLIVITTLVGY